jgi:hypothetical protein
MQESFMSSNLAIQLSDGAFAALSGQAAALGQSPSELAASVVEAAYSGGLSIAGDPFQARQRFEKCIGSVDLGRPIGIDNEGIDADLAREY